MSSAFTSCDWGTTHLRLRIVEDGLIRQEVRTSQGVATLKSASEFRDALGAAMAKIGARAPVIISGMAGASIGWKELPYAAAPFPLDGSGSLVEEIEPGVFLVSGVRTADGIMRGEETELMGLDSLPEECVVILPGTHSKHCLVRDGWLVDFSTFMTGELYAVLSAHSVLKNSVSDGWSETDFLSGVETGAGQPLLESIFRVRARHVLDGSSPSSNGSFLSGLLVGAELAALPAHVPLVLAAGGALASVYQAALPALGLSARTTILSGEECAALAVRGHRKIIQQLGI